MRPRSNGVDLQVALTRLGIGAVVLVPWGVVHGADANSASVKFSRAQVEFYQNKIQPILVESCYKCHSHQADKIKGGFVLDSREGLLNGGEDGPVITPGDPEKSLLIKAVRHEVEDLQMPPKKKLPDEQIALLFEWVKMGAPYSETSAAAGTTPKSRKITQEDRKWWSFQPVREVKLPEVKDGSWSRNGIDKFILARLQTEGLRPGPEADKRTLVRRAYFDLIGLPPGAEEVERFVADRAPDAYEKLIDGLLRSPQYGEKWARHWLDLVRYAESDGFKADGFRPNAWRYRDYVIRGFNQDKPYDQFMMEQLAADELWPSDPEALIGVSYLRLPIYEYNQRNVKAQWTTIINDITDVTGDVFLGLGMQCARCHDHKFDPILQRDYYRLQAFFAALCPHDEAPLATPEQLNDYSAQLANWQAKTAGLRAQIEALERPAREKTAKAVIEKLPKEIQVIMNKSENERTPYEQQINDLAYRQVTEELEKLDGKFGRKEKEQLDALKKELANYDEFKPEPLPKAMLVTDIGPVAPPVAIPKDKSQTPVEPGFLTLLEQAPAKIEHVAAAPKSTGRRAALARWLAQPDNPFTTRVIVNRIWQQHFGRGLVGTPSDFGHLGEQPTHPELLDWLARYFVEHRWSLKQMHRLILTSATYRQASNAECPAPNAQAQARLAPGPRPAPLLADPDNRWLWRQNLRRLESDQIRDAMLWVSGELDTTASGPSVDASKPRRTIYTKWLRNSRDPLLDAFDPPDPYTSTAQRNVTTTPMQSLMMINGPYALQRAQALANRIKKLNHRDDGDLVRTAYRVVYGREPSSAEKNSGVSFLKEQTRSIAKAGLKLAPVGTEPMPKRSGTAVVFKPDGGQTRLQVPDNHLMPQYDFTIEGFIVLRSVGDGGTLRTIVSRWDGRKDQPGWSLGIAGKDSNYPPQSLILELVGDPAEDGAGGYEALSSGIRIELDTPYFVAVSVRIGDTSESGVTFYAKELTAGAPLQSAHALHKVTANHQSNLPLVIGARDPEKHQVWDGLIDDVRLSGRALGQDELLLAHEGAGESTVGYWRFEAPDFFNDSSPHGHNIKCDVSPGAQLDPETAALIDLCHVLLNSNEFLYVD